MVFTDEWGGGTRPRCRATDPLTWGADAIYDIVDKKLVHKGYYKMPAPQTDTENCVAHNGSLIPVPGRDLMVQAWYQGGVSVFDFTDSANPVEIAFFDRGPINPKELVTGGYWSSYWYNGYIYGAEISRGIDVFRLLPSEYLSAERDRRGQRWCGSRSSTRRTSRAMSGRRASWWPRPTWISWCATRPSTRRGARRCAPRSTAAIPRGRSPALDELDKMAADLERDAAVPGAADARRYKAMAEAIKARTARLR